MDEIQEIEDLVYQEIKRILSNKDIANPKKEESSNKNQPATNQPIENYSDILCLFTGSRYKLDVILSELKGSGYTWSAYLSPAALELLSKDLTNNTCKILDKVSFEDIIKLPQCYKAYFIEYLTSVIC